LSCVNSIVFQLTSEFIVFILFKLLSIESDAPKEKPMHQLTFAATVYRSIRDRLRIEDPQIDEQTLADTVEGLTDVHEILTAVIRAALADQALSTGLEGRIGEMEARRDRLQNRAAKRRQIAKDVMVELDLKKLAAPDFTASIRPGTPALMVIDEAAVPSVYWEPREPRLNRQELANDLKQGAEIAGVTLSNPEPVLSVRTK
jgi:Siphovirus Gp157